jgi:hypothetical protein
VFCATCRRFGLATHADWSDRFIILDMSCVPIVA